MSKAQKRRVWAKRMQPLEDMANRSAQLSQAYSGHGAAAPNCAKGGV